jgi:serine/threonine protein kinase
VSTDVVLGGYRQVNLMMTGQTSQVWEVVEVQSGRHFALKLLLPETARASEHRGYLFKEANVGLALSHPNCIKILKLVQDKNNPYIIMEFFPGKNLKLRIMHKDPILKEKCHSIITQAASGLAHVNGKGWVHRDVKPDNILVNSSGEVRIIDFALAKRMGGGGLFGWFKKRSTTSGTRSYMSPEQILGKSIDARADLYSFGSTLYEVVTGRPPFRGLSPNDLLTKHLRETPITPMSHNPDVTEEFANLILRMLAKDKKDRPQNFAEFLSVFRGMRVYKTDKVQRQVS